MKMFLNSALFWTLVWSTFLASNAESTDAEFVATKNENQGHVAVPDGQQTAKYLSLIAPKEFRSMKYSYVRRPEVKEEGDVVADADFDAAGSEAATPNASRNLRQRPRNPTYKPSNNAEGYFVMDVFRDMPGDMCDPHNKYGRFGIAVGSCFAARQYHGAEVLGSFKVGVVVASSGRKHTHVESYSSADCSGEARRVPNLLSRLHFDNYGKVPVSTDPSSRHYLPEFGEGWWGDHVLESMPITCLEYSYQPSSAPPMESACIYDGFVEAFGVINEEGGSCTSPSSTMILFTIEHQLYNQCVDNGMTAMVVQCEDFGRTLVYNNFGYYTDDGQHQPDLYCDYPPNMISGPSHHYLECKIYTPENTHAAGNANYDDDDYFGGPHVLSETVPVLVDGWNITGHPGYNPGFNVVYSRSKEGADIHGSMQFRWNACWNGFHNVLCEDKYYIFSPGVNYFDNN